MLVEAALIDLRELDLAKALVLCRTVVRDPFRSGVVSPQLIRRSGEVVPWNEAKIERAVRKGFISAGLDSAPAAAIAARVSERVRSLGAAYVAIEQVQDLVQEELVLSGSMRVAERYIVYRAERALLRAGSATAGAARAADHAASSATGARRSGTATSCASGSASRARASTSRSTRRPSSPSCDARSTTASAATISRVSSS